MRDSNGAMLPERRKITTQSSTLECLSVIHFNDAIDRIKLHLDSGARVQYSDTAKSASVTREGNPKEIISLIL